MPSCTKSFRAAGAGRHDDEAQRHPRGVGPAQAEGSRRGSSNPFELDAQLSNGAGFAAQFGA